MPEKEPLEPFKEWQSAAPSAQTEGVITPQEEYHLLKAVNKALMHLLSGEELQATLQQAFQVICEAIGCDGLYVFDKNELQTDQVISHLFFGLRQVAGAWERVEPTTVIFPIETPSAQERINNFFYRNATTINLTQQVPEKLRLLLESMDIASYMSFQVVVDGAHWGGAFFVSRQPDLEWTHNRHSLLMPFAGSLGNFIARKQIQQELKVQHDYFKQIIDVCPNPIFAKNHEGIFTMVNQAMAKSHRLEPEDMIGQPIHRFMPDEQDAIEILKEDAEIFATGAPKIDQYRQINTLRGERFLQISKFPLFNNESEILEVVTVITDLTDLKSTETQLRAEKHFSESINRTIPDWVLLVDLAHRRFEYHNIKYPVLGYNEVELSNPFELLVSRLHPEDKPQIQSFMAALTAAAPEEVVEKHFRLQHKDGHWIHFYERAKVMSRTADGQIETYLAVIQDITSQIEFQQRLERSEQRYRNFINYSQEGIYYMNCGQPIYIHLPFEEMTRQFYEHAYIEECNTSLAKMYGASIEDIKGEKAIKFHGGEHYEENVESFKGLIANGFKVSNAETIEPDLNGNFKYFLNSAVGVIENEHLVGFWGTQVDITEKKIAEQNLIKNKQLLKAIINTLPDLKFRIDKQGLFLDFYESEYENESTFVPAAEFIGKKMEEILPSYVAEVGLKSIHQAIATKQIQTFEYYVPLNEELLYYEGRVSPLSDLEVIVTVRNISEQKRAQLALQEKLHELDEKNKQLTQYIESNFQLENFAYIASHDLREPVRTVHSFAQLLSKKYRNLLDEDGQKCLDFIIYGAENMNRLIEDLLTYSRVSSESHKVEPIQVSTLLADITRSLTQVIHEKNASLSFGDLPPVIHANPTTIKQLFQNLLVNAIKFHHPNRHPSIQMSGIDHGEFWLFEVKDNGMGIPPDMQDKIFQLFKKFHYVKEHYGTGIGLALCKRVVEQHGGEIWVESLPEQGSSFYFTIKKQQDTHGVIHRATLS